MLTPYTQAKRSLSNVQSNKSLKPKKAYKPFKESSDLMNFGADGFFNDFHNDNMQIFKQFNDFSGNIFNKIDKKFGFGSMMSNFDEEFNSFSDLHNQMHRNTGQGTVVQRSYVSSTKLDSNGNKIEEKYYKNNVAHKGYDGNTISEKHEAYKNTGSGLERIAQERMLNEKGRKYIQERNRQKNEELAHDYFYNISEEQKNDFDMEWDNYNNKVGFLENNMRFLKPYNNKRLKNTYDEDEDYIDNHRRGEYIPSYRKNEDQPIPFKAKNSDIYRRPRNSEIQPIMLGNRPDPINHNEIGNNLRRNNNNNFMIRNNQDKLNGLFRNKNASKNNIPKAG